MTIRTGSTRNTLVALVVAGAVAACAPAEPAADLAITNVTVIDAVNGVRESQTVLVDDGMIVSVADAADARAVLDDLFEGGSPPGAAEYAQVTFAGGGNG